MSKTVNVASHLPMALRMHFPVGRDGQPMHDPITLNGSRHETAVGGRAITVVDEDAFRAWQVEHASYAPVESGSIYIVPDAEPAPEPATEPVGEPVAAPDAAPVAAPEASPEAAPAPTPEPAAEPAI